MNNYEIHLTVKLHEGQSTDYFQKVCEEIDVKPIIIDLQTNGGSAIMQDVMTSSKIKTKHSSGAIHRSAQLANILKDHGFNVVRRKIESDPWHSTAPQNSEDGKSVPTGCYFESHIKTCVYNDVNPAHLLAAINSMGLHMSRNPFKKYKGHEVRMFTLRQKNTNHKRFRDVVNHCADELNRIPCVDASTPEIEFAIFDSNIGHDSDWIKL